MVDPEGISQIPLKWQLDYTGTNLVFGACRGTAGGAARWGLRPLHCCICHNWVYLVQRGETPQAVQAEFIKEATEQRKEWEEAPSIISRYVIRTLSGVLFSLPLSCLSPSSPFFLSFPFALRSPHKYAISASNLLHPRPPPPVIVLSFPFTAELLPLRWRPFFRAVPG